MNKPCYQMLWRTTERSSFRFNSVLNFCSNLRSQLWVIDQILQWVATAEFIQQPRQVADYSRRVRGVNIAWNAPNLYQRHVPIGIGPVCCADLQRETSQQITLLSPQVNKQHDEAAYWSHHRHALMFVYSLPPGCYRRPPESRGWCWTGPPWGRCCCWWSHDIGRYCGDRSRPNQRKRSRKTVWDRSWSLWWWSEPRSTRWCLAHLEGTERKESTEET